jgi:hypothetical protein
MWPSGQSGSSSIWTRIGPGVGRRPFLSWSILAVADGGHRVKDGIAWRMAARAQSMEQARATSSSGTPQGDALHRLALRADRGPTRPRRNVASGSGRAQQLEERRAIGSDVPPKTAHGWARRSGTTIGAVSAARSPSSPISCRIPFSATRPTGSPSARTPRPPAASRSSTRTSDSLQQSHEDSALSRAARRSQRPSRSAQTSSQPQRFTQPIQCWPGCPACHVLAWIHRVGRPVPSGLG